MKVILQQDVKGQGKKGQMVEVSDGYARNFLLPRKLAVSATADNINTMKQQEKARKAQEAAEKAQAEATAKQLEGLMVKITAKAGEGGRLFGAVTAKEISEALAEPAPGGDRQDQAGSGRTHQGLRRLSDPRQAGL